MYLEFGQRLRYKRLELLLKDICKWAQSDSYFLQKIDENSGKKGVDVVRNLFTYANGQGPIITVGITSFAANDGNGKLIFSAAETVCNSSKLEDISITIHSHMRANLFEATSINTEEKIWSQAFEIASEVIHEMLHALRCYNGIGFYAADKDYNTKKIQEEQATLNGVAIVLNSTLVERKSEQGNSLPNQNMYPQTNPHTQASWKMAFTNLKNALMKNELKIACGIEPLGTLAFDKLV